MTPPVKPEATPAPTALSGVTPLQDQQELLQKLTRLVTKNNGDTTAAMDELMTDNKNVRQRCRDIEALNAKLADAQIPQGGMALTADQRKLWEKLQELKVATPEALATLHKEHGEFVAKDATDKRLKLFADMAGAKDEKGEDIAWDPKLLGELLNLKNMDGELRDAIVPDKADKTKTVAIKIPYVKPKDNPSAAGEPLTQYATRELSGFLDALRKAAASQDPKSGDRGRTPTRKEVPPQSPSTPAPTSQAADGNLGAAQRVLAARYGDPFAGTTADSSK